ncbi:MAG: Phosphate propanoyltransferase [Candidatus Uhrbacteria bacterium GW2011_GWE2_40_58]|nr:MAG: Phosphate propanoyltransferase [Candidatus Uhrbacteria bacterium GW2011_GWF2_40_263]KKR68106.1 MAG: Phosphate propanoyltransferase [Candidatus Uhrbacteria bacterium GW2011_GWE2_40_58]OGL91806.1 MAG: hypothetical protein A2239_04580 [Candidatus Uhrbacteria bacterium RIFOXYA2_FULL_40_9]OGL97256.1 MAG: hypothetical protein A2332_01555 [Candidatus Uhrbacteria bacterium RIFOXYB2_FULL_41_18]
MQSFPTIIQYRHIHLSSVDHVLLFGENVKGTTLRKLGQKEQVVFQEMVEIIGKNGVILKAHVLGPERDKTQVELSATEAFALGINAPLRVSGDSDHSASCILKGPKGEVQAKMCVIIPVRHLHLPPRLAKKYNLEQGSIISLQTVQHPFQEIDQVIVRIHPTFRPEFHLTFDEASTFWLQTGDAVHLL